MPQLLPRYLQAIIITQLLFGSLLLLTGISHIAVKGQYSLLSTGIYCSIFVFLGVGAELWLKQHYAACSNRVKFLLFGLLAFTSAICAINCTIISVVSILKGDATGPNDFYGQPRKSCRWVGEQSNISCVLITHQANVPALICDGLLIISGLTVSVLFMIVLKAFWTVCSQQEIPASNAQRIDTAV